MSTEAGGGQQLKMGHANACEEMSANDRAEI
jgi:hypothetical protein